MTETARTCPARKAGYSQRCGAPVPGPGQRADAVYCSVNCQQRAAQDRQRVRYQHRANRRRVQVLPGTPPSKPLDPRRWAPR